MNIGKLLKSVLLGAALTSLCVLTVKGFIISRGAQSNAQGGQGDGVYGNEALNLLAPEQDEPPHMGADIEVWNGSEARIMPLEEYLEGVVSAEMPALFEPEALKAQSVAARTFAYRHMQGIDRCKSGYTICTDAACCQAYKNSEELRDYWKEDYQTFHDKISAAVRATAGLIATVDGKPISALYHSNSGGRTEDSEAVFALALPYLVSVESSGEDSAPCYKTQKEISSADFVRKLNAKYPEARLTAERLSEQVAVLSRTQSGRISLIQVGETTITGSQMRLALGLNSANFEIEFKDACIEFTCFGYGHGVGMSQYGANAMAKDGADFSEILKHYYTGIDIEPIGG